MPKMVMNSMGHRNFMQPMGRLACTQSALIFFFQVLGGGEDFFHFFFVPNMFPSSS
jgi:hypothetical protein